MTAYATTTDLSNLGLPTVATAELSPSVLSAQLEAASAIVDSYFGRRYAVPLGTWNSDVRVCVVALASYRILMFNIGFNPNNPQDLAIESDYKRWLAWLRDVAEGNITPGGMTTDPGGQGVGSIRVEYETSRGLTDGEWFGES